MATQIKLSALERRILNLVFGSDDGFERVEDIHAALGAEDADFVDALEHLEGDGYLAVRKLGGAILVGVEDPIALLGRSGDPEAYYTAVVAQC